MRLEDTIFNWNNRDVATARQSASQPAKRSTVQDKRKIHKRLSFPYFECTCKRSNSYSRWTIFFFSFVSISHSVRPRCPKLCTYIHYTYYIYAIASSREYKIYFILKQSLLPRFLWRNFYFCLFYYFIYTQITVLYTHTHTLLYVLHRFKVNLIKYNISTRVLKSL